MTTTAPPTVAVLPATPARLTDTRTAYVAKTDAWQAAMPTYRVQMVSLAANVYSNAQAAEAAAILAEGAAVTALGATSLVATSNTSISMAPGTTSVTLNGVSADIDFVNGEILVAKRLSDPNTSLTGEMQSRSGLTFNFIVGPDGVSGTGGPYSDWSFVSARFYASAATKAQVLAASRDDVPFAPISLREFKEPYALSYAATITPDGLLGRDFTVALTGDTTLAAIENAYPGMTGRIRFEHVGGPWELAYEGDVYRRRGDSIGLLSTSAGVTDELRYDVVEVDGSDVATRVTYDILRNV